LSADTADTVCVRQVVVFFVLASTCSVLGAAVGAGFVGPLGETLMGALTGAVGRRVLAMPDRCLRSLDLMASSSATPSEAHAATGRAQAQVATDALAAPMGATTTMTTATTEL
jgi:hypothetical protein